jgi:hypothetical protein
MKKLTAITVVVLLAGAAEARPLLCALTTVLECDDTATCSRRTAESASLPPIVLVDPEERTVSAVGGSNARAPIMSATQHDGRLIVHGGEAGRGWSATITEATGKMAVAVVDDDVTFSIFGTCVQNPGAALR